MSRRDESGRGLLPDLPPAYPVPGPHSAPAADKQSSASVAPSARGPGDGVPARRITRVYNKANLFGLVRWSLSILVLAFAGRIVAVGKGIPSLLPLAGFNIACASLNVLLLLAYFAMRPASPTTPRPAGWYVGLLVAAPIMWVAAVATGLDMIVITRELGGKEQDLDATTYVTESDASSLSKAAVLCTCFSFAALLSCLGQCYHLCKLKRDNFTPEEIRYVYDSASWRQALPMHIIKDGRRGEGTSGD